MGTRSATGQVNLSAKATIRNVLNDGSAAQSSVGGDILKVALDNGVGTNQITRGWARKDIPITSGGFLDIDICTMASTNIGAGAGKDAVGQAMDIEEIVLLIVTCTAGPGQLQIMATLPGAAPVAWIKQHYASVSTGGGIREGGMRLWFEPSEEGLDVLLGSSNVLRLSASGGDVTADVYVFGRHDDNESSSNTVSSSSLSSSSASSQSSSSSSSP